MSHLLISKLVILNTEALLSAALQTDVSVITHLVPTKVDMGFGNFVLAKHTLKLRGHGRPIVVKVDGTVVMDQYGYSKPTKEDVRQLFTRYNLIDAVRQAREEFGSEVVFTDPVMNDNGCVELDIILDA